jgi:hypothetical protein
MGAPTFISTCRTPTGGMCGGMSASSPVADAGASSPTAAMNCIPLADARVGRE